MDAKAKFKQRVRDWSEKIGVEVVWLGIRPMRRKWASCSTNGHLNFNEALLHHPPKVQDYVIVHELLHLRVPNHGKLFKSLMRAHLGEWEGYAGMLINEPASFIPVGRARSIGS